MAHEPFTRVRSPPSTRARTISPAKNGFPPVRSSTAAHQLARRSAAEETFDEVSDGVAGKRLETEMDPGRRAFAGRRDCVEGGPAVGSRHEVQRHWAFAQARQLRGEVERRRSAQWTSSIASTSGRSAASAPSQRANASWRAAGTPPARAPSTSLPGAAGSAEKPCEVRRDADVGLALLGPSARQSPRRRRPAIADERAKKLGVRPVREVDAVREAAAVEPADRRGLVRRAGPPRSAATCRLPPRRRRRRCHRIPTRAHRSAASIRRSSSPRPTNGARDAYRADPRRRAPTARAGTRATGSSLPFSVSSPTDSNSNSSARHPVGELADVRLARTAPPIRVAARGSRSRPSTA